MCKSTKDKIKEVALVQFARQGFHGTSMNDIAAGVGIKKPSLYAHFSSKDELFFSIYEDLARNYITLMERLLTDSQDMKFADRIYYIFEHYIRYYLANRDIQGFWNQMTLFTPSGLHEKFSSHIREIISEIQPRMEEMFSEGMRQGVIRKDDPEKMIFSYRAMTEGVLNWMLVIPDLKEEQIKEFWRDLWLGLKAERGEC